MKLKPTIWWAVTRGPESMPCLFGRRKRDALAGRESDEYVVRVIVREAPKPKRKREAA